MIVVIKADDTILRCLFAKLRQLTFRRRYAMPGYTRPMEPGEKFIGRFLKFVLMILAFIISIVFGEYYRGLGWAGALIFVVGAAMGALGIYLFKSLRG